MSSSEPVLEYASPVGRGGAGHLIATLSLFLAFASVGTGVGASLGRLAIRPTYASRGVVVAQQETLQAFAQTIPPAISTAQTLSFVTSAVVAARQNRLGTSLYLSPSEALSHTLIGTNSANNLLVIQYEDADPQAASRMASELVKAYMNVVATGRPRLSVYIVEQPRVPHRPANEPVIFGVSLLGGIFGAVAGVSLFLYRQSCREEV